jgi:NosR/NirI family nitrous oxide reductase transcriptional regulator
MSLKIQNHQTFLRLIAATVLLTLSWGGQVAAQTQPVLQKFLNEIPAQEFVDGATAYGAMHKDLPVVPILSGTKVLGYAYITSDFV